MARQRPPTDELKTEIYDSQQRTRGNKPTKRGHDSGDSLEIGTPTAIDPPRERSEPIRVISMKTPAEVAAEKKKMAAKKKKPARMTRQQEIDQSIDRGTVPARYRNSVPKEYHQYIPFDKQ